MQTETRPCAWCLGCNGIHSCPCTHRSCNPSNHGWESSGHMESKGRGKVPPTHFHGGSHLPKKILPLPTSPPSDPPFRDEHGEGAEWGQHPSPTITHPPCTIVQQYYCTAHGATATGLSPSHFQKPSPLLRPNLPAATFASRHLGMTKAGSSGCRATHPLRMLRQVSKPT